ncbi:uncharacterized protein LOC113340468 isoform X2 [Papaver somniferum]|uniref:uncharacterized protein LOC113340468 isoform X2 n=1 Tax=Papaver somniferum TaxID=3469 RepID=UPI000E6FB28A|nr:uncharacterized protein LOC113340468 isoform X2 [Papaver somniferum]
MLLFLQSTFWLCSVASVGTNLQLWVSRHVIGIVQVEILIYCVSFLDQHSAGISSTLYKEFDKDGDGLIESDGKLAMLGQFMTLVLIVDAYGLLLSKLLLQWGKGEEIVNLHEVTEDPRPVLLLYFPWTTLKRWEVPVHHQQVLQYLVKGRDSQK